MNRLFFTLLTCLCNPLLAQQIVWQLDGSASYEVIGYNGVLGIGDVNGDRVADAVSVSRFPTSRAFAICGATGTELWSVSPPIAPLPMTRTINSGGDINGDGIWDVAFAVPGHQDPNGNTVGALFLLSGADGSVLRQHTGTVSAPLPEWCSGPIIGDADADGFDDYIVLSGGSISGQAILRSGRTGGLLQSWSSVTDAPSWASPIGDVDGDGHDDVLLQESGCAAPFTSCRGAVACYSGATGSMLYRVYGDSSASADFIRFRGHVCSGDDLNGDGVPDFVVSADIDNTVSGPDRGMVRAYSGLDGTVLWSRYGNLYTRLGVGTSMGDDWNGDGYGDVLAMQWAWPILHVLSGVDGTDLQTYTAYSTFLGMGGWLFGVAGDLTGDGYREVLLTGNNLLNPLTNAGSIFAIDLQGPGLAAYRQYRGSPCLSSNGNMPRMRLANDPRLGSTATFRLRGAAPTAIAVMLVGSPQNVDLTPLGATGCSLLVDPVWISAPHFVDAAGMTNEPAYVPPIPTLAGVSFEAQWGLLDPGANALGITFSEAVTCRLGL